MENMEQNNQSAPASTQAPDLNMMKLNMLKGINPGSAQRIEEAKKRLVEQRKQEASQVQNVPQQQTQQQQPQQKVEQKSEPSEEITNGNDEQNNEGSLTEGENSPQTEETSKEERKSLIFGNKKKQEKQDNIKIESLDDFAKFSKKWGIEIKDASDYAKVIKSVDKWRADSQKLVEVEKKAGNYEEIFENLEPDLLGAIQSYYNGQDWRKSINTSMPFDINKPVDSIPTKDLVNHYFPGKFTDEDFDSDEKPTALEIAEQTAKEKFIAKQDAEKNAKRARIEEAKVKLQKQKQSIDGSVNTLRQSFPDVDITVVDEITKTLEGGNILSEFLNSDGSYKPDAAKKLMLLKYGEQELRNAIEAAELRVETKMNEEFIRRSPTTPPKKQTNGNASPSKHSESFEKAKNFIKGMGGKKSTF